MEIVDDEEPNCFYQVTHEESKGDGFVPNLEVAIDKVQHDDEEPDGEALTLEGSLNSSSHCDFDANGQQLPEGVVDQEDDNSDEHYDETCLDFHNSHVVVDTMDSESFCESKEEQSSSPACKWPDHDEALPLWVKWRGKWQAGIKCERADWPLATVKAKPTHDRKNYVVIFFPHTKNYSWADTLLVCAIDEFPQPIAHRSYKVGAQLVEDLTVARRFIMKKLVIGILNIVDQLPLQVLVETAQTVEVWREFASDASRCKGYPDLGRLLLKLWNMFSQQYIDGNWLQHSLQLWVGKCQNAFSAESIELLKEEIVDSILWNEVNVFRDSQVQSVLGSEWRLWKHEAMRCFSTRPCASDIGNIKHPNKHGTGQQVIDIPLITSIHTSRKRPKLEIRRAEQHNPQAKYKSPHDNIIVEIDSTYFAGRASLTDADLGASKGKLSEQRITSISSPCNLVRILGEVADDTSITELVHGKESQPGNGVDTNSSGSKPKNRQCVAFIEAKGRRCVRWANDGDDYCCVHLTSRFMANYVKTETTPPADTLMCQGTTTLGTRCKHRSLPKTSFCKKHRPQNDAINFSSSPTIQLKRKYDELLDQPAEHTSCKDIVVVGEAHRPFQGQLITFSGENASNGGNNLLSLHEPLTEEFNTKSADVPRCVGLGLLEGSAHCTETPNRHSLYCEKHIPNWLKRARNGKSRIISKEVFLDLLRTCSSWKQKVHLHEACELFYKLLKSVLSLRNQVPKEIQFQWALAEASKDVHVAKLLMNLISTEKERLRRIWGFNLSTDSQVSSSIPVAEQAIVPMEEESDYDGALKCKICSEEFNDDQTLGAHWIDNHNREAQWLFRGYACAICLDSFTNRKVLETHVQERHHAQFVENCMLIQCIPCGSHFGNFDELWLHVLSAHTEGFRQSKTGDLSRLSIGTQQKPNPSNFVIENNSEGLRKYICKFCGLRFDMLPDLGRHHQAAHMGPTLLSSFPKKKGLRFYSYRLKSGRLSRPRLKKGLGGASYRLRKKNSIVLKKRIQPVNALGGGRLDVESHIVNTVRLTEAQCSAIAKMLCCEAQITKARPNNHEILSVARSTCCRVNLQGSLEQKYGMLPERLYLKAAKLCSEHNVQVDWHQKGFHCPRGCKPPQDENLVSVLTPMSNVCPRLNTIPSDQQEPWDKDECHYVIDSHHFRQKPLQTTVILCDDISFGQEAVPISCVVDKNLIDSLHTPTYGFDGRVIFMPWESFKYVTKPRLARSLDADIQNLQLGCGCADSTCSPEKCDHVYLFNTDHENAKDIDGKPMDERFPYDGKGRIILEEGCIVYECNHLCKCSRNCQNRVLQNGVKVKSEVFKTEKKGWGVRSCEPILRGTFVCELVGEVLDLQEANRRRERYGKEGCKYLYDVGAHMRHMNELMKGGAESVIDATMYGNISRFLNHSCSPNLVSHLVLVESMDFQLAHIGLYAKQDIAVDEELTYDYGHELLHPCLCGASTCLLH